MVFLYLVMMALTGYFTFGLQKTLCHTSVNGFNPWRTVNKDNTFTINKLKGPIIRGYTYDYNELKELGLQIPEVYNNTNLNSIYLPKSDGYFKSSCKNFVSNVDTCHISESEETNIPCQDINILNRVKIKPSKQLYTWDDLELFKKKNNNAVKDINQWDVRPSNQEDYNIIINSNLLVFNSAVLNITNILNDSQYSSLITNDLKETLKLLIGKDATLYINRLLKYSTNPHIKCLMVKY